MAHRDQLKRSYVTSDYGPSWPAKTV